MGMEVWTGLAWWSGRGVLWLESLAHERFIIVGRKEYNDDKNGATLHHIIRRKNNKKLIDFWTETELKS